MTRRSKKKGNPKTAKTAARPGPEKKLTADDIVAATWMQMGMPARRFPKLSGADGHDELTAKDIIESARFRPRRIERLGPTLLELKTDIPDDLDTFFKEAIIIENPVTGEIVEKMSFYQHKCWEDRSRSNYRLLIKAQKLGISTSELITDLHVALTYGRGMEILIIGQTREKAIMHLFALVNMIRHSPTYSNYLIDSGNDLNGKLKSYHVRRDVISLHNPDNPLKPTRIYALGITNPGSLISFRNVVHVHMSDVALASQKEERMRESFVGLYSRLANTQGTMVIETPPRGPSGPIWDIVSAYPELQKSGDEVKIDDPPVIIQESGFLVRRLTHKHGTAAGMMTQEYIDRERYRDGVQFGMFFGAEFFSSDRSWFDPSLVRRSDVEGAAIMNDMFNRIHPGQGGESDTQDDYDTGTAEEQDAATDTGTYVEHDPIQKALDTERDELTADTIASEFDEEDND